MKFRRASRCSFGDCVEVGGLDGEFVTVRSSVKVRSSAPYSPQVTFTREEWQTFIDAAKAGEFDLKSFPEGIAQDQMEQV
jgi:hypothetical protein